MLSKKDKDSLAKRYVGLRDLIEGLKRRSYDPVEILTEVLGRSRSFFMLFDLLGLDRTKLSHQRFAAGIYIWEARIPKAKKGRPKGKKNWTVVELCRLGALFEAIEKICPEVSNSEAAQIIKLTRGWSIDAETIRKRLPEARRTWAINRNREEFKDWLGILN